MCCVVLVFDEPEPELVPCDEVDELVNELVCCAVVWVAVVVPVEEVCCCLVAEPLPGDEVCELVCPVDEGEVVVPVCFSVVTSVEDDEDETVVIVVCEEVVEEVVACEEVVVEELVVVAFVLDDEELELLDDEVDVLVEDEVVVVVPEPIIGDSSLSSMIALFAVEPVA